MIKMKNWLSKNGKTFIELFLACAGITGFTIGSSYLPSWEYKLIGTVALCLIATFIIYRRSNRVHTFKPNSPEMALFFETWYNQEGKLTIFCSDLNWIASREITKALNDKAVSGHLNIHLKNICSEARRLKTHGAKVYQIPDAVHSHHKFSILKTDNHERIIFRSKTIEPEEAAQEHIEFISTSSATDPYLIALANDVLLNSKEI